LFDKSMLAPKIPPRSACGIVPESPLDDTLKYVKFNQELGLTTVPVNEFPLKSRRDSVDSVDSESGSVPASCQ
jgi:hypothetical protein